MDEECSQEDTMELCERLARHLESTGHELFEKNYLVDDAITGTVFCVVGPRAEEMTALVREWAVKAGLERKQ